MAPYPASNSAANVSATAQPITVLLADPNELTRSGLRSLLQADPRFEIVGEVFADVVAAAQRLQPDLIILDPFTEGGLELDTIAELGRVARSSRLVILTSTFEPQAFMAAMLKRVHGYCLLKDYRAHAEWLLDSLALIAHSSAVIVSPSIAEYFRSLPGTPIAVSLSRPGLHSLTKREQQVLSLAAQGLSDKEVGDRLQLTVRTVEYHLDQARQKLGATSRIQLGSLVHELGLS